MADFASCLIGGNAKIEYVFHVGGMPWAVSTNATLIDWLKGGTSNANAVLRDMFGDDAYDTLQYYAYLVDIYPLLEVPGPQTITSEDAMGVLSNGKWAAKISDIPPGDPKWPFSARATITGLEGVHCVANPRIDTDIMTARLSVPLGKADPTIYFQYDSGGRLGTACAAATGPAPLVVWIGGECISIKGGTTSGTAGSGTVHHRGILNSKDQYHSVNPAAAGMSTRVADAPLNGIMGRPYYLWAFVVDDDCVPISGPVKLRHGKVSGAVQFDGTHYNIDCLPWWSWLDTDLKIARADAKLNRFVLAAYDEDAVELQNPDPDDPNFIRRYKGFYSPHIILQEYDADESVVVHGWLCDPNEAIAYDTVEDLEVAYCDWLTANSPNGWTYYNSPIGPLTEDCTGTRMYRLAGDLFVMLQWGDWFPRVDVADWASAGACPWIWEIITDTWVQVSKPLNETFVVQTSNEMLQSWYKRPYWGQNWVSSTESYWALYDAYSIEHTMIETPNRVKPAYIMQWGFGPDTTPMSPSAPPWKHFPVPYTSISGTPTAAIYVRTDYNIQSAVAGTVVQIGTDDTEHPISVFDEYGPEVSWTSVGTFYSAGTGAGTSVSTNYIIADDHDEWSTENGYALIKGKLVPEYDPNDRKYVMGMMIWGRNDEYDYFPILDSFDITASKLSEIFLAILGHGVTVDCSEMIQADHVPDYETIDWDQLDSLITMGESFDVSFQFRYYGTVNLFDLLTNELKFHGLTMTYTWDNTDGQYRIGFRRVNAINATMAHIGGRSIDEAVEDSGSRATCENASTWQVNAIKLSANYNARTNEYEYVFDTIEDSGLSSTGGKSNVIEIAPKITHINGLADSPTVQAQLIAYLCGYLENTMDPRPAATVKATVADCIRLGVGNEALATIADIHNPFFGSVGITDATAAIAEQTLDPGKAESRYKVVVASRQIHGWAPTMCITASTLDGTTVTVEDIDENGQMFCGTLSTPGWYDHWFFADCVFNTSMTQPELISSDPIQVTLIERGSTSPTIITGCTISDMTLQNYAAASGASLFCTIENAAGYDDAKEWWCVYGKFTTDLAEPQHEWIYLADSDYTIEDDDDGDLPGRVWE